MPADLVRRLAVARGGWPDLSGLTGHGLDKLMDAVFGADAVWNRRVPTSALNRWLARIQEHHPPPLAGGRRLRLRYMTQVNSRPPSFARRTAVL